MDLKNEFKNQIILITGADSYIARELLNKLNINKSRLILIDLKFKKKNKNKNIDYYEVDFLDENKFNKIINLIKKKYPRINKIINIAGFTGDLIAKSKNKISWKEIYQVNLYSVKKICTELKSNLIKSKDSAILNVSSIYGQITPKFDIYNGSEITNFFDYSSSKSSLIYLTFWLAKKLSPKIRVNCISPGGIVRKQSKTFIKKYSSKTLLKRMAKEEDIVWPIIFLISNSSKYVTGQNLIVDGGFSIK
tara:strand:- start:958 stop:1704 length:747 start_codon:yes stop_codon:yes gene_type:complete